mgnify:CR=1 FL=1
MSIYILLLILIPLITAFLIPLVDLILSNNFRRFLVLISAITELSISLFILIFNIDPLIKGDLLLNYHLGGWLPPLGINLAMDGLALIFSTLISVAIFLIMIYSIGFIGHHEGKYYVLLFLVLGAMQGVILTGDIFNLYVFIELLTVTSAPLVAFNRNKKGTEAAIKYMFYGVIGGLFFFIGVILIYFNLGTLNMAEISNHFTEINYQMQLLIISIFLLSLLIKLGIYPFHFWLSKAHSACPGSISALLSGVLLKVYIYVFIRTFWFIIDYSVLQSVGIDKFIIYLTLLSCLLGHIFALQADDIKKMLAYSTIGHIGMIIAVLALNTSTGFYGGILHVISHLLMKSTLFLGVGYLLHFTQSHQIKDFDGVAYKNNKIFISFIIAALGMIGLPPIIGFFSKWYILLAFLEVGNYFGAVVVILGSLTAVVYYLRYVAHGYRLMEPEDNLEITNPLTKSFYREKAVNIIVYVFTFLVVSTGLFYRVFHLPITAIVNLIMNPENYIKLVLGGG